MGTKNAYRPRDPQATRTSILNAARLEFARVGLGGARVDRIAQQSGANKRMIYHYFGGKEKLFAAVVLDAYESIRAGERGLVLEKMPPMQALKSLVEFTWRFYLASPEFITLVNSENLHQARHIAGNKVLRKLHKAYVDSVTDIVRRGEREGVFRRGVDVTQLCISIAAIGFYYLNNRHTGGVLFGFNFMAKKALDERLAFNLETIVRLVACDPSTR